MFNRDISINELCVSMESVLLIEYRENMKTEDTLAAAIERLENTHSIKLDTDVFTLMNQSELMASSLAIFMRDLKTALSSVAFYTALKCFHADMSIVLSSVNYLGFDREELLNALKILQDSKQSAKYANDIIPPMINALDQIPLCTVKRLFYILLTLYKIGVVEGVSVVANLLYLGGLVI